MQPTQTLSKPNPQSHQNYLYPIKDLTKIYPDIQHQLCSRHSTLFGKLKIIFNKLYDKMEPTHYVIVKGNTHIIGTQNDQVNLSMGLQNGIIILVSKTFQQTNIYINGNHMDEQLILTYNGKLKEGLYQISQQFQIIYQTAIKTFIPSQLFGGIIYIHANIPQGFYNYRNSLLTGLFLSAQLINNSHHNHLIPDLISQITQSNLIDLSYLQTQFYNYTNRQLSLIIKQTCYKIPINRNLKLLFCKIDLATSDLRHSQTNIKYIKQDKNVIVSWLKNMHHISSFYQAFKQAVEFNLENLNIDGANNQQKTQYLKLIQSQLRQLRLLSQYLNKNITLEDLIMMKWIIDSQVLEIFPQQVVQLVQTIKQKINIPSCTIVQNQYLMIVVDSNKYADLICILRQLFYQGQLKSKSFFSIEDQIVQNRWNQDHQIGQKIFVSVPSKGIAIFDPSQAIWFD